MTRPHQRAGVFDCQNQANFAKRGDKLSISFTSTFQLGSFISLEVAYKVCEKAWRHKKSDSLPARGQGHKKRTRSKEHLSLGGTMGENGLFLSFGSAGTTARSSPPNSLSLSFQGEQKHYSKTARATRIGPEKRGGTLKVRAQSLSLDCPQFRVCVVNL